MRRSFPLAQLLRPGLAARTVERDRADPGGLPRHAVSPFSERRRHAPPEAARLRRGAASGRMRPARLPVGRAVRAPLNRGGRFHALLLSSNAPAGWPARVRGMLGGARI